MPNNIERTPTINILKLFAIFMTDLLPNFVSVFTYIIKI